MEHKNVFVRLAETQRSQGTAYSASLDIYSFGSLEKNVNAYQLRDHSPRYEEALSTYSNFINNYDVSACLATIEAYLIERVISTYIELANIRTFKLQSATYEQFGPGGYLLLQRITEYLKKREAFIMLDCKKSNASETQAAAFRGLLGNLRTNWGINYSPYNFDLINIIPWLGEDTLVLGSLEEPGLGLELMRSGKGLVIISQTPNDSGPQYQELTAVKRWKTLQMCTVIDAQRISEEYNLEKAGLSAIGLGVGATRELNGQIRKIFPTATLVVSNFDHINAKFANIMPEYINQGEWRGQGVMLCESGRASFAFLKEYGGSGQAANLEEDLLKYVRAFRAREKEAFNNFGSKIGLRFPFF